MACGTWGHRASKCKFVPKVAIALKFMKSRQGQTERLVQEFRRINDKRTKAGVVRALLETDSFSSYHDPEEYLRLNDVDIPMEDTAGEIQMDDMGGDDTLNEDHLN